MITGLLSKLGIAVLGLGTTGVVGYGIYEIARPKSIKETLLKTHKILDVDGITDDAEWTNLANSYSAAGTEGNAKQKIDGLNSLTVSGVSETQDQKTVLKNKCKELLVKKYLGDQDRDYLDTKNWCAKINT